uniref:Exonuclease domain-containing protein n=1 Tax=Biomphalaria glabrata TaxID=6526 RepID=A0A2C9LHQ9_BIOGL
MRLNVRLHYKALTSIFSKGFQNTCHTHHTVHSHFCTQNYYSQTLCLTPKRHKIDLIGKTLWQHFKKSRSIYSSCCRSNRSNIFTLSEQKYSSFCSQLSARQYSQDSVSDRIEINNQNLSVSKKLIMAAKNMQPKSSVKQNFDFFLVLDFEATCDKVAQPNPQEIIEFPVLKVNATTMKVDSIFHQYVRPQFHPQLTTFCTELTGIIQAMVDNQPHLPQVLQVSFFLMTNFSC